MSRSGSRHCGTQLHFAGTAHIVPLAFALVAEHKRSRSNPRSNIHVPSPAFLFREKPHASPASFPSNLSHLSPSQPVLPHLTSLLLTLALALPYPIHTPPRTPHQPYHAAHKMRPRCYIYRGGQNGPDARGPPTGSSPETARSRASFSRVTGISPWHVEAIPSSQSRHVTSRHVT